MRDMTIPDAVRELIAILQADEQAIGAYIAGTEKELEQARERRKVLQARIKELNFALSKTVLLP